ncbi:MULTISPECIES: SDR family NAD(P)-dependent oxidoreductase [Streptomyces]|uniref:SDR family NAD(P)-dependent oxidoreductase n=1 Tax=Streptomyces TaxID=1883 RepID=UPI00069C8994|nr:SDR family NAD(P)-dependent oxidoreductase [Streptomyces sp. SID7805]MYU55622.1 SDR family NAD(P)-dependent oxidoreductase [Streptomyces sp. SID7805]
MAQVVVVTGAASGIGAAVARHFGGLGAHVVVADIDKAGGEAVAKEVGGLFVRTDTTREADNLALIATAVETYGGLDLVHLNAGVGDGGGFAEDDYDTERQHRVLAVNLHGVMFGLHAALPALAAHGGGSLVVTSSMAGASAVTFDPVYAATKHGVIGLVRSLAPTWQEKGVRINAICPGFVRTSLLPAETVDYLVGEGFAVAQPAEIAASVAEIAAGEEAGRAYVLQAGRAPDPVSFPKFELVRTGA